MCVTDPVGFEVGSTLNFERQKLTFFKLLEAFDLWLLQKCGMGQISIVHIYIMSCVVFCGYTLELSFVYFQHCSKFVSFLMHCSCKGIYVHKRHTCQVTNRQAKSAFDRESLRDVEKCTVACSTGCRTGSSPMSTSKAASYENKL